MPSRGDGAANRLSLAATPVSLLMALLTTASSSGHAMAADSLPLGGMTVMYLLMALFHAPAWLKLAGVRSRRRDPG